LRIFGVVKMFKQSIKSNKKFMRFKSKTKQKAMDNYMSKNGMCTGKNEKQTVQIHK